MGTSGAARFVVPADHIGNLRTTMETRMSTSTTHHATRGRKRPATKPKVATSIVPVPSDSAAIPAAPFTEPDRRHAMISDAAYFLAEQRDFCPGHELEDWLTAEREIDYSLNSDQAGSGCGT